MAFYMRNLKEKINTRGDKSFNKGYQYYTNNIKDTHNVNIGKFSGSILSTLIETEMQPTRIVSTMGNKIYMQSQ